MKRTLKKAMSILLAATFILCALMFNVSDLKIEAEAKELLTEGDYIYSIDHNGNAVIIDVNRYISGNIVIPLTLGGYPVTTIGNEAFYDCYNITGVTLHNGITSIDEFAFYKCYNLSDISISDSVTNIGDHAFEYCFGLTNLRLPDSIVSIGDYSFSSCSGLKNISFGNGLKSIGVGAFSRCGLVNVIIPQNITSIGCGAFANCQCLESISVDEKNPNYSNDEFGVLFNKNKTEIICYPAGKTEKNYSIPISVSIISQEAFACSVNLKNITIPNNIISIGYSAFAGCKELTDIIIPDSVTIMGDSVFGGCSNLTNIKFPSGITSISYGMFSDCDGLKSLTLPDKVSSIGEMAFFDCEQLTSITFSNSVTSIGKDAFYGCYNLSDIYFIGTEKEWDDILIDDFNETLERATVHFVGEETSVINPELTTNREETTVKPTVPPETTTKPQEPTTKPNESVTNPPEESTTTPAVIEEEIIKKPSTSTVKYGETLILHADFENVPEGTKIDWNVEGDGVTIKPSADGLTCAVTSTSTGDVTITAKYTDANGVEHVSEQELESNASFWQKIVSFFKNLFGINRIIEQAIKF